MGVTARDRSARRAELKVGFWQIFIDIKAKIDNKNTGIKSSGHISLIKLNESYRQKSGIRVKRTEDLH
jgi:hypothetical protein